jgi:hypothetical protein
VARSPRTGRSQHPMPAFVALFLSAGLAHGIEPAAGARAGGPGTFDFPPVIAGIPASLEPAYHRAKVDDLRSPWEEPWLAASIEASQLLGRWVHSHEEDQGGRLVFRPGDFAFPPSRGRTALVFAADGELEVEGPGPADRRRTTSGHWSLQGNVLTTAAPGWSGTFEIEAVDERKLVLRRP